MGRNDYTKAERDVWQAQRLAGERARASHMAGMNNLPRTAQGIINPKTNVSYEYEAAQKRLKAMTQRVQKEMNASIREKISGELKKTGPTRTEIDNAVKEGKTLVATIPSDCFSDVYYEDGVCTAVFARDGYVWEEEMTLDDFLDFAEGPSLGRTWNAEWRD